MEEKDLVEEFYGVYLLKSLNPKYTGRTYIGYTVDPNRRIKQHNKGKQYGGAWKTSQKGPWEMTLTVHGFPSDVAALRFEWAWQHPKRSRRLKNVVTNKKSSESSFDFCLRVMFTMLRTPPWSRLPLTLRWLSAEIMVNPPPNLQPPIHMPIVYGPVVSKKVKSPKKKLKGGNNKEEEEEEEEMFALCKICYKFVSKEDSLTCLNENCTARWHIVCLAKRFLDKESSSQIQNKNPKNIIPVEGVCTECHSEVLWGDLVRKKKGCYRQVTTKTQGSQNVLDCSF